MWHILMQYIQQTTYQLTIIRNTTTGSSSNDTPYLVLGGVGGGASITATTTSASTNNNVIRERNAIVRSLIGMGLHGALDSGSNGSSGSNIGSGSRGMDDSLYYWSGGTHSMHSSCHATSHMAAVQQAQIRHYASLATQLRRRSHHHGNSNDLLLLLSMVVQELNQTLQTSAFLLPYSSTLSFVDMDVAVALSIAYTSIFSQDAASAAYHDTFPVHVQRWMRITMFHIQQLARVTQVACPHPDVVTLMDHVILASPPVLSSPLVFYNGTEDVPLLLSQWSSSFKHGSSMTTATTQNTSSSTTTTTPKMDAPVAATVVTEPGTGSKKLTKQDKKAAAAAAKAVAAAAAGGGEATTTTTTTTAKVETATPKSSSEAPVVAYDITAMDIRIGKIIKIWPHESADKLYCEDIDFGNGEVRQIASGLRPFYPDPNDLLHQSVLVVYNLKKRSLVGFSSHGMVLCASNADHTAVELIVPPPNAPLGERIVFEGLDPMTPAEPDSKVAKKKIFEAVAPDLVTNESGYVQWKTHAASCSVGPIRAVNGMALAHVA